MATAPSPNDLTRQQLEELDALLQRMLSLPITSPEAAPAARVPTQDLPLPEASPRVTTPQAYLPPAPTPAPRENVPTTLWRGDAAAAPTSGPQLLTLPAPSEPTPAPVLRKPPAAALVALVEPVAASPQVQAPFPASPETPSTPAPVPSAPAFAATASPATGQEHLAPAPSTAKHDFVPPALKPLVFFNGKLNGVLGRLGLAGRIACSSFGKNALALLGLAVLVYTGAHVAQRVGWASLPIDLPWPG